VTDLRYPATRTVDVVDELHGERIPDPYRWLEDAEDPETVEWIARQNALTEEWLARRPGREGIRRRLRELLTIGVLGVPTPVRGRYFYLRRDSDQNHPVLYVREGIEGTDRALLDPNAIDPSGTTALDWYYPSHDGRLLAYGLSQNGSEQSELHVRDVATGEDLPDRVPRTRAASLAWLPDGSGFYYTRYPAPGEVPVDEEQYHRAIHFHPLGGDPAADPLVLRPARKEYWPGVSISPDGRWLLVSVERTFDQTDVYLGDRHAPGGSVVAPALLPVAEGLPASFSGEVAHGRLFLRTDVDAPTYRLYEVDPEQPERGRWRELVPPREEAVLDGFAVAGSRLALTYLERASSRLRLADLDGGLRRDVELPALGSLFGLGAEWDGRELFFGFSSFTVPPTVYRIDLERANQTVWRRVEADVDPGRYLVRQVMVPSRDGTPVSMFLVHRRGLIRDGNAPTYLNAYGGFNVSMTPVFMRSLQLWLEHDGVVAVPNIRGGGEYGETWHQGGMLARKQNSFDDFIAAAEWLIREGYTRPERLAAEGGSNGGLLMGAALTQRPELFRAVVVRVPLLDMLRYHRSLIARLWIPEYGSAEDAEQFAWLRAYSPYHHVRSGTRYPAVLLTTGASDTRVDPMHARKMAARLQAATTSGRPVLLRLEARAGHGAGKPLSKILDEYTDTWTFVFSELGVEV
jgi:prolyl oligopeptidase